jgi:hypothetical protein
MRQHPVFRHRFDPCTMAAPTTPAVIAFASDIDRSVRWYREDVGPEIRELLEGKPRMGDSISLMARNGKGVTLAPSPGMEPSRRDPQLVCFVVDDPPAPSPGSKPLPPREMRASN